MRGHVDSWDTQVVFSVPPGEEHNSSMPTVRKNRRLWPEAVHGCVHTLRLWPEAVHGCVHTLRLWPEAVH